jgi:5-methylthioadenosine/S-adenosylhomocysteine deaminase
LAPERTLLKGGVVVTMDSARRVIRDGAVGFEGDTIVFVGKSEDAKGLKTWSMRVDASIMPGLICAHTHLYGIALRAPP